MTQRRLLLAAAVLGVIVVAALAFLLRSGGSAAPRAFLFPEGASKAWRFRLSTTVVPGDGSGAPVMVLELDGRLTLRVLEGGARPVLAAQLSPLQVRLLGADNPAMVAAFSVPFVFETDPRGQLGATRFPADVPSPDRAVLDSALRSLQVVLPPAPAAAWEAAETDQNGSFVASYAAGADGALVKSKLRYDELARPGLAVIRVLESRIHAEADAQGLWLRRLEGSERLRLEATPGTALTTAAATVLLEPAADAPDRTLALFADEQVRAIRAPVEGPGGTRGAWDQAMLEEARRRYLQGKVTIDDLVGRLAESADANASYELRSYLLAFPDAANGLADKIPLLPDAVAMRLLAVLGRVNTPQAQGALLQVMDGAGHSPDNRVRALAALAGSEQPSPDALERVARYRASRESGALASTALATLGAMAASAPPEVRARVIGEIDADLRAAKDPSLQRGALLALANAKAEVEPAALGGYLAADDAGVRAAAARVAATSPGPAGTAVLVDRLGVEQDGSVRGALLDGLLARPADARASEVVAKALAGERESEARERVQLVNYLARDLAQFPGNRAALEAQLKRETDRQVLAAILGALRK